MSYGTSFTDTYPRIVLSNDVYTQTFHHTGHFRGYAPTKSSQPNQ